MAAELQPQPELPVMGEQHAFAAAIDQPAGRGEMPGLAFAQERVVRIAEQLGEQRHGGGLRRPAACIRIQRPDETGIELIHVASRHVGAGDYPCSRDRRRLCDGTAAG